jgi:hypothetical protein
MNLHITLMVTIKESVEIQLNNYELFAKQLLISSGYEFD